MLENAHENGHDEQKIEFDAGGVVVMTVRGGRNNVLERRMKVGVCR